MNLWLGYLGPPDRPGEIAGSRNVTPMMLYVSLGLNVGVGALIAFMIHAMQSCVAARGDLRDASSLMLSFQNLNDNMVQHFFFIF